MFSVGNLLLHQGVRAQAGSANGVSRIASLTENASIIDFNASGVTQEPKATDNLLPEGTNKMKSDDSRVAADLVVEQDAIKVFQVNDYEWWAGINLDVIRREYLEQTGIDPDNEDEGFDNPKLLTPEAMQRLRFCHDDGDPDEIAKYEHTECTFAERLNELIADGARFPCSFAGTEY